MINVLDLMLNLAWVNASAEPDSCLRITLEKGDELFLTKHNHWHYTAMDHIITIDGVDYELNDIAFMSMGHTHKGE